jgi:hypothetical protein
MKFRLVYYAPDPRSVVRFTIAVIAQLKTGVKVFLAPHVPGDEYLGGAGRARVFERLQQLVMKARDFDRIPGLGPYCEISAPIDPQYEVAVLAILVEYWGVEG